MKSYLTGVRDKKICNGCITLETRVVYVIKASLPLLWTFKIHFVELPNEA